MYEQSSMTAEHHSSPAASQATEIEMHRSAAAQNNNDPQEQEADAMADDVIQMPVEFVQRKCGCEEEEKTLQRKPLMSFSKTEAKNSYQQLSSQLESSRGNGKPLSGDTKKFM